MKHTVIAVNWPGRHPGYYVQRLSSRGFPSGHLSWTGGWALLSKNWKCFTTLNDALSVAAAKNVRQIEIFANRIP